LRLKGLGETEERFTGLFEEALEMQAKAILLEPTAGAHYNHASLLRQIGRPYREQIRALDLALLIDPKYASALVNRGATMNSFTSDAQGSENVGSQSHLVSYRSAETLSFLDRAIILNPSDAGVWFNRGKTFEMVMKGEYGHAEVPKTWTDRRGLSEEALSAFRLARDLSPLKKDNWFALGSAMNRLTAFHRAEARALFAEASNKLAMFSSPYRYSGNVELLKKDSVRRVHHKPFWNSRKDFGGRNGAGIRHLVEVLEQNWEALRDEARSLVNSTSADFLHDHEDPEALGGSSWHMWHIASRAGKVRNMSLLMANDRGQGCWFEGIPKLCKILQPFMGLRTDGLPISRGGGRPGDPMPLLRRREDRGAGNGTNGYYSVMRGATHVTPHCGPDELVLRLHLALQVPKGGAYNIRVGRFAKENVRQWKEGRALIFTDSIEHEVWAIPPPDNAKAARIVLVLDLSHPEAIIGDLPSS
jgi:tetratricopeptide (TPR) repeat protein